MAVGQARKAIYYRSPSHPASAARERSDRHISDACLAAIPSARVLASCSAKALLSVSFWRVHGEHGSGVISSRSRKTVPEQASCVVDMSSRRIQRETRNEKAAKKKGIGADHVGDTTPDNASTTKLKPLVGHIEDTRIRTPDNRRSGRVE